MHCSAHIELLQCVCVCVCVCARARLRVCLQVGWGMSQGRCMKAYTYTVRTVEEELEGGIEVWFAVVAKKAIGQVLTRSAQTSL